jgi:hypothetical protein
MVYPVAVRRQGAQSPPRSSILSNMTVRADGSTGSWAPGSGSPDPGFSISPGITKITGITDQMVAGHCIDDRAVDDLLDRVVLVIAHNADFDRRFPEKRFPVFATKHWACSRADIEARRQAKYRRRRIRAPMTGYPRPSNLYPHAPHLPPDHGPLQRTSHCHSPPTCRIERDRRSRAPLSRLESRRVRTA